MSQFVSIIFCIFFLKTPTSDNRLIFVIGSNSLAGLDTMQTSFPLGQLDPYFILLSPPSHAPNSVLTSDYFAIEKDLIQKLLINESPDYIDTKSISALSYYNSQYISFADSMTMMHNTSSAKYNSSLAVSYRLEVGSQLNFDSSASLISIETVIDPDSQAIVGFINDVRSLLITSAAQTGYEMYLIGGYTTTLDVQNALYAMLPLMIGLILGVVLLLIFSNFRSIFLTLRLAITVIVSLAWTYGLMVISRVIIGRLSLPSYLSII